MRHYAPSQLRDCGWNPTLFGGSLIERAEITVSVPILYALFMDLSSTALGTVLFDGVPYFVGAMIHFSQRHLPRVTRILTFVAIRRAPHATDARKYFLSHVRVHPNVCQT
jgi:hypothetical protein